jgi:diadenosine tetraphosphatase ApaH/serine/threonine PP2A family protein phosphatase
VGYGANPNEVIELLRDRGARGVMGNHDQAAVTGDAGQFNPRAAMAIRWTMNRLTKESAEYLRLLPLEASDAAEGVRTFMAHGSPDDRIWEYVDPRTHSDVFPHYLARTEADLIALGHTHVPYVWSGGEGRVFNPGSVGQPRDGDPRAAFAVVAFDGGEAAVELRRVGYDVAKAAEKISRAGLPLQFADRLLVGR